MVCAYATPNHVLLEMKFSFRVLFGLLLMVMPVLAAQDGLIVRRAPVYLEANIGSGRVGELPAGTKVSLFARKGGWQEIYSDKPAMTGWVRSYQVRGDVTSAQIETTQTEDSRGFLSGLASWSRKASGFFNPDSSATSSSTATIGVRGLSEDEIRKARADYDELERMEAFASNAKQAKSFARKGGLKAKKVPHVSGAKQ